MRLGVFKWPGGRVEGITFTTLHERARTFMKMAHRDGGYSDFNEYDSRQFAHYRIYYLVKSNGLWDYEYPNDENVWIDGRLYRGPIMIVKRMSSEFSDFDIGQVYERMVESNANT